MSNFGPKSFSDYDVRVRAHRIWERKGRSEGQAEEHWREALADLEAEYSALTKGDRVPPHLEVSNPPVRTASAAISKSTPKDQAA